MKPLTISLIGGKYTLIDSADHKYINNHRWYALKLGNHWYAGRKLNKTNTLLLHRLILHAKVGEEVDHIDGDGLNNLRLNLRIVTKQQNLQNQHIRQHSSAYKGVTWEKRIKRWKARITHNYRIFYLGSFQNQVDAARAYNKAALRLFGEYARLNQLETGNVMASRKR